MNSSYELTPVYDVRSSFYRKAYIEQYIDKKTLFSYGQEVLSVNNKDEVIDFPMDESKLTHTTLRHIREFLKQEVNSDLKWTKKEILSLKNGLEVSSSMTLEDFLNGKDIMDFINNDSKSFATQFKLSTKDLLLKELRKHYEHNLQLLYNREFNIIKDNTNYLEESLLILREITRYVEEDYLSHYNYVNLCFKLDEILEEISLEDDFSLFESISFFIENWK